MTQQATSNPMATNMLENSPGARLRHAREESKQTIQDIAKQIHLSSEYIKALENDNFQHMPNPIFIRGYIRSYAKALMLNGDELIGLFNQLNIEEKKFASVQRVPVYKSSSNAAEYLVKWGTYGLVIGLLALVFLWWRSQNSSHFIDPVVAHTTEQTTVADNSQALVATPATTQPVTVSTTLPAQQQPANTAASFNANTQQPNAQQSMIATTVQATPAAVENAEAPKANEASPAEEKPKPTKRKAAEVELAAPFE